MIDWLRRALILLFLLVLGSIFTYVNLTRPRILVLQSYQNDYAWTRDVDAGLNRVLRKNPKLAVRWHYMDTKNHPWPDYIRTAAIAARAAIADYRPDVLIVVDDDAQRTVGRHYAGSSRVALVFAGVNGDVEQYGYDRDGISNVTGLYERQPLAAVRDVIVELGTHRGLPRPRVVHIADASATVQLDAGEMQRFDWGPLNFLGSRLVSTWAEWQKAVEEAQSSADFILVSNYRKIARSAEDATLVPFGEIMPWTESHSTIPVLGTNGFNMSDGSAFAIGASPFEQGEVAAQMAVSIVEGQAPASVKRVRSRQFTVSIREEQWLGKRLSLPAVFEAFARATDSFVAASPERRAALLAEAPPKAGPAVPPPPPCDCRHGPQGAEATVD